MVNLNMKNELDKLNYGCSVDKIIDKESLKSTTLLSEYTPDKLIEDEFLYVYETIKALNSNWHMGVVSTGAHSEDFSKAYGFKIDNSDKWNNAPVMFVYECPGNNVDATRATSPEKDLNSVLKEIIEEKERDALFEKLLCKTLWHADCGKDVYYENDEKLIIDKGSFLEFGKNHYSEFLLQLILEFKLSNLYTTNLFRYEIFELGEKKGSTIDSSINLRGILWPEKNSTKYYKKLSLINERMVVFKKELEIVKPNVIFTTSNPYYCIKHYYDEIRKTDSNILPPKLVKVPHPASYLSSRDRYLENKFRIIKALENSAVITPEFAEKKISEAYKNLDAFV